MEPPVDTVADLESSAPARSRHRGVWIGAIAVGAVIVAAAVATSRGGHHDGRTALQALTTATARTTGSTVHVETVERTKSGDFDVTMRGSEDEDLHNETARSTLSFSVSGDTTKITTRLIDGVSYTSESGVHLPGGVHWIRAAASQLHPAEATGLGSADPTSGLDFLSASKRNPRVVGHATIAGSATTHYSFEIDFSAAVERELREQHAKLSAGDTRELSQLHRVPAQAWIDGSDHVRRFALQFGTQELGAREAVTIELDFSRFGEHLSVSEPDRADTISAAAYQRYEKAHPDAST